MYAAASDRRKATAAAISSGAPTRPIGAPGKLPSPGWMPTGAVIGVSVMPGCTELTRILASASSTAPIFDRPRTPHLEAPYPAVSARPVSPAADEMLTMEPPPFARSSGIAVLMPMKVPTRLISTTWRKCSTLSCSRSCPVAMPALFTSPSIRPNSATAWSRAACQSASLVTSCRRNRAAPPSFPAVSAPSASSTSVISTRPPPSTTACAAAAPSPRAPPVMTTALPLRSTTATVPHP